MNQWPYGNTFHSTHRHKSAANTTTKHPNNPNSSQTVTDINGTEPSWLLQILLKPNPVDKCYNTASIIHNHRQLQNIIPWNLADQLNLNFVRSLLSRSRLPYTVVCLRGVIGLPTRRGGLCSIPGGIRNFNLFSGTGCVLCVLRCLWQRPWHCTHYIFREVRLCVSV